MKDQERKLARMKKPIQRDLFPGALEMMILRMLKRQPMHGYALVQQIKRTSQDLLQIEEGSLYPALQRLLKEEFVKAEWGISPTNRRVRIYKLTAAGAKHLEREVSSFERMLEGITRVLAPEGVMNWLKQLFARRRMYRELSEEIQAHLDEKVEELVADGMPREEAMQSARREFGNVGLIEENSREVWTWPSVEEFFFDIRYGLRALRRNPVFTDCRLVDDRDWNRRKRGGLHCCE